MNKFTLLIFAFLFTIMGYSQFPVAGIEGFESTAGPNLPGNPSPWTLGTGATGNQWAVFDNGVGLTKRWTITTVTANIFAGTNSAYMDRESLGAGFSSEDYLATPLVVVPPNGQLHFWTRSTVNGTTADSQYLIKVNTNTSAGSQTTIANYTSTPQQWTDGTLTTVFNVYQEKVVDLSAFSGQPVYIAFVLKNTQSTASLLTLERWLIDNVSLVQQCLAPTGLAATPQATTATLSWLNPNATNSYEVEIVPAGGVPTGTGTPTTSNPYTAPGLTANTAYDYYIRVVCGPGLNSVWVGPFPFTTTIAPIGCNGNYVDTGGSTGNYNNNENNTTLICPSNSTDLVTVTFTAFNTEAGADQIRIYDGSTTAAPLLGTYSGTALPPSFTSSTPGGCLTYVFTSDGSVVRSGWIANITCAPPPTCPRPTTLVTSAVTSTTGTLAWTNNSTATQFEVLALPCASPPPSAATSGTLITPGSNSYIFTGLSADTCYTLYVRAVCSPSDKSAWSDGVSITTQITPPACNGIFSDPGGVSANYDNGTDSTVTICPDIPGQVVTVTFTFFNTEATWDGLYVFDGNTIGDPLINSGNGPGNVPGGIPGSYWGNLTGALLPGPFTSTSPDGCLTFRFRSDGSVNNPGWSANVSCASPPTCPNPNTLVSSAITSNSVTLGWINPSTATTWHVIAQPCGSPAPTPATTGWISTNSNPHVFIGLNPDTCYDLYVQAECPGNDLSNWVGPKTITTLIAPPICNGTFTDPGGATGNYGNNENVTTVIVPDVATNQVTVTFTSFNLENNFDFLSRYDGNSTAGALLGTFSGTNLPPTFTSSAVNGCLTFVFTSDGSVTPAGWIANVTCAPPPTCPRPTAVLVSGQTQVGATISWTEVGSATTWEVLILPAGSPVPTAASTGIITSLNPYIATGLSSGTAYVVYIRARCNPLDISLWSNPASFTTLIVNDECANAIVAPVNTTTTCTQTVGGTVIGATASSQPNACGGTDDDDVWFQFTATSTSHTINLLNITGSTADLFHVLYSGTCGALTQLYCSDPNTSTANGLIVGQTYYIRVYSWTATGNQTSVFNLCIGTPVPPPSCITNTPAGNTCATATPICNLNGYCGNTSAAYTDNSWPELDTAFCGSIENNSFLSFVASATTISFDVWVSNAQNNNGIQIMVFSAANCGSGPVTNLTCWSPGNVASGSTNVTANGLIPGNTYYIMIDGFAGDVADYVIGANSGIQTPIVIDTSTSTTTSTICLGQTATLTATGGNGAYTWSPAANLNTTTGSSVIFSATAIGSYTITATSTDNNPICPQSGSSSQTIIVTDIVNSNFNQIPSFCEGTTPPILPSTSINNITGTWSPATVSNVAGTTTYTFTPNITFCANPTTMDIVVNPGVTPLFLTLAPICPGAPAPVLPLTSLNNITGTWFPAVVSNTTSGTYTFTPTAGQCAVVATLNVTVNTSCDFGSYASAVWLTNCATSNCFNTVGSGTDIIGPVTNVFPNTNLGTYVANSSALILRGGEVKTFKSASANVCSARLNYRIYPQAGTPGVFQVMDLPFFENCGAGSFPSGGPCQTGDQKWQRVVADGTTNPYSPVNLTAYPPGNYVLEVYYDITGDLNSTSACDDTIFINNNGANYSATYTIQAQPIYSSVNPTTCNGTEGTITIAGLAQNQTYSLSYMDGSVNVGPLNLTSNSNGELFIFGLDAGTYSAFELIINNCSLIYNTPIVLTSPSIPTVTVNSPTSCQGTPAILIASPLPAGSYSYVWTVPVGVTNPGNVSTFGATVSGTYSVIVTSTTTNCSSLSASGTVTINANPTVTVNSPTVCQGASATITAIPGTTGNYSYSWTVPTGTSNPGNVASFDPIITGSYSVIITDISSGCSSSSVVSSVVINPVPTVTVNSPTICLGQTATVTATVGIAGSYTYSWTVPTGATDPGDVASFTTTIPGTYSVIISAINPLCNLDFEAPCGVPAGGMALVNQSNFSCWNTTATDGIIEVWSNNNEGVPSYSGTQFIELNANQVSSIYQNLSVLPGSTVNIAFAHRGRFTGTDVLELQVGPVGGPYVSLGQFSAQPSAWVYNTLAYTFPNNTVTNYTLRFVSISSGSGDNTVGNFIDAISVSSSNCSSLPASGTVTINPVPTVTVNSPSVCSGAQATVTATPGVSGTYSYVWSVPSGVSNPGDVATFTTLIDGVYSVVITDTASGCSSTSASGTVTVFALPTVTVTSPTVCQGTNATVTATPGTAGSYTYSWTVPSGVANPGNIGTFNATVSGTYSVIITNTVTGCTSASATSTVTISSNPTVTVANAIICQGSQATISATPGTTGTYSYVWTVPSGATPPGNVATFTTTIAGTYSVIITNTLTGCFSSTASGTVTINATPTVTVNSPTVCQGTNAPVTASPGTTGTYSYSWTAPTGVTNPGNVATFNATVSGTYSVIITNTLTGCVSSSASGTVTINTNPTVTVADQSECLGSQATLTAVPGTSGTYTYLWTVPAGVTNPGDVSTFNTSSGGTYDVVITNASGCTSTSDSATVTFVPALDYTIKAECVNNNFILEVIPSNNTFDVSTSSFAWEYVVGSTTTPVGSNNATFDVTNYVNSTTQTELLPLTFSVNVTSAAGCQLSQPITITRIYCDIQKGISPNGDALNEFFDLQTLGVQQLSIYNRYGSKVYSRTDYTNQWVGQTDSGNELPDGTYYYVIEFKNNQSSKTGWIYINREIK
jgi:gliding motility-associated-like protein